MSTVTQQSLAAAIRSRLLEAADAASSEFHQEDGAIKARHFVVDNVLPVDICMQIYQAFPEDWGQMREMKSLKEHKFTSKSFDTFPQLLHDISLAFQDQEIIRLVETITGIRDQIGDPLFYAGGLSMMGKGNFLNPHIDNSHDSKRELYRTLNLLYYVTPDWNPETGGNLELWDEKVRYRKTISSEFNRLVVMETNPQSWHSVSPVTEDKRRCCVSNYYFSKFPPTEKPHFHVTSFNARPEQKLRRAIMKMDTLARMMIRKVFRVGLGRKDVYQQPGSRD